MILTWEAILFYVLTFFLKVFAKHPVYKNNKLRVFFHHWDLSSQLRAFCRSSWERPSAAGFCHPAKLVGSLHSGLGPYHLCHLGSLVAVLPLWLAELECVAVEVSSAHSKSGFSSNFSSLQHLPRLSVRYTARFQFVGGRKSWDFSSTEKSRWGGGPTRAKKEPRKIWRGVKWMKKEPCYHRPRIGNAKNPKHQIELATTLP